MNSNEMCGCNGTCSSEEKTSSAIGLVKINYKQDFELVVELLAGDKPYQLGDEDFRIDFIVMASRYTVGRTGGVCERCAVDGNKIRCFMDGHGLPPGELRAEVKVNTPDPNYADGKRLNVAIAEGTVVLVKDNTRFDGAVIKANIPVALVDAYDLAKGHGYKGTIDEYYATFTDVGQLKENIKGTLDEMTKVEKLRADAEAKRASAEQLRVEAETKRVETDKEIKSTLEYVNAQKYIKENEYERDVKAIEAIKNAPKDPTQDVWLDATDGEIKSGPAEGNLTKNAITYYYLGKRMIKGAFSGGTRESAWTGNIYIRHLDVRNWDMTLCTDASIKFNGYSSLASLDASGWNLSALSNGSSMFNGCNSLQTLDFRKSTFRNVTNFYGAFDGCHLLAELWLPLTFDKLTSLMLSDIYSWGSTDKGLASLRWAFGEGADDRTAKGLQPCTVKLHANVYDRLTDTERAAAAKKGWTITK